MKLMWRAWYCLLVGLINTGVVNYSFLFLMLWFCIKYRILNLWLEVLGSLKFYIIGSSVGWCVVRGIGAEVDIYICDGLDSDVGGDVESGDGRKIEL